MSQIEQDFIADTGTPREILARIYQRRDWREIEPGRFLLEERIVEEAWSRVRSRWILVDEGRVEEWSTRLRMYGGPELGALLRSVGFAEVRILGDLEGSPYDPDAERLVAVARR